MKSEVRKVGEGTLGQVLICASHSKRDLLVPLLCQIMKHGSARLGAYMESMG